MSKPPSFLFLLFLEKDQEIYACCECNSGNKAYVLYTYYDQELAPHCKECFLDKMQKLKERVTGGTFWEDAYHSLNKKHSNILNDIKYLQNQNTILLSRYLQLESEFAELKKSSDIENYRKQKIEQFWKITDESKI